MEIKNNPNGEVKTTVAIEFIEETVKPTETKTFIKRGFGLIITEEINGNPYQRRMALQCTGDSEKPQFDKTKMLDEFKPGDLVDIVFAIMGNTSVNTKLTSTPNNPGCLNGFNNLSASKITRFNGGQQGYQPQANFSPAVNHPVAGQPTQNQASAPAFFPQPAGVTPPQDSNGQPFVWNTKTGVWEELPF